ncbi:DUF2066 domain-containing protein [Marinobacterium aestuariivivens]|uniref:DUF2066 domain-containing protein n=1 Tax=Marinobacterium aestuariivivens TaxID=1698799 RepID=A0ABW2A546_9GAMM
MPGYASVIEQAPMLLSQYRYRPLADGATLELHYDQMLLDGLLEEAGIRGPGAQRPALLLWLVVVEDGVSEYVAPGHPALNALETQARRRGLPLQLPLLDLEDQQQLPPERLWALPEEAVRRTSGRYRPDAILVGRLESAGGAWRSEFRLFDKAGERAVTPEGELAPQMVTVVDRAADRLFGGAERQAFSYRPRGLVLKVEGVENQEAYLQLVGLLRQTQGVSAVFPERFAHGGLQLRLQLDTSVQRLQQSLDLESRLEAVPLIGYGQMDETGVLQYRWRGQ